MKYKESLEYVASHPWLKRVYSKLKCDDIDVIDDFFKADFKDIDEAMLACNRMFMDIPIKPKRWAIILEVCSCTITHHFQSP
jgi:hypothetical protein